ncbi:MAG: hypothetical protein QOH73_2491 [Gaiellaceae bacterium]|jgi:hypothetical protein|nr:hypothetical protein [Gaiellaceae bacterium]
MTPARMLLGLGTALLALATAAQGALGSSAPLRFASAPARVAQGGHVDVTVAVRPASAQCALSVRYANGARQAGLRGTQALGGRATWSWDVPIGTAVGRAQVVVRCTGAGTRKHILLVVGAQTPLRVDVLKQGFSIRNRSYGGADVSYGVILQNRSTTEDAMSVNVLVNFVMTNSKLSGSASTPVTSIPAGGTYALGGNLSYDGIAPVDRLEVVVTVGKRQPHKLHVPPIANIYLEPSSYDAGWMGAVDGELINDDPLLILQSAQLSAVVLDAGGNVVGGATGYAFAPLPPSARELVKLTGSVTAIPVSKAASALVSVIPTYVLPNSG